MKPLWEDAPGWANYLAMDGNYVWYWYEAAPNCDYYHGHIYSWKNAERSRSAYAMTCDYSFSSADSRWKETLEIRPV